MQNTNSTLLRSSRWAFRYASTNRQHSREYELDIAALVALGVLKQAPTVD